MGYFLQKMRRFVALPWLIKLGLLPTWLLLGLARLLVLSVPFRRLAPGLGRHAGGTVFVPLIAQADVGRAQLIARLVQTTARYCPWQANCFAQAIVARVWLRCAGIPYALYFGVAHDAGRALSAHAWVCAGPVAVTGGADSFTRFAVIATFVFPGMPDTAAA